MTEVHEHLVEDQRGQVTVLRIDREKRLGALNEEIMRALGSYLRQLADDKSVRVLVITGTGRGFIAGADIGGYDDASVTDFSAFQFLSRQTFEALESLPQPTIAAVNGFALGGGFELTLCTDLVVATEGATFGLPEIKLGLLPGGGGTQRLARLVGERIAKEVVLTGRSLDAEEAEKLGLVTKRVPDQALMGETLKLAEHIAAQAPVAAREGKRVIHDGLLAPLPSALTLEQRALFALFGTEDAKEGIQAFMEKRDPKFRDA